MKISKHLLTAIAAVTFAASSCEFSPTTPFAGFDEKGSRLNGRFQSDGGGASALTSRPSTAYDGLTVYVEQAPSITTAVKSNGSFTLVGLPQGTIAVVFEREGQVLGRLVFQDVVPNQELRIVVRMTASGQVELLETDRDNVGLGDCARGPGFWCQNRTGKNPNMTRAEFEEYASGALERLRSAGVTDTEDIGFVENAVCDTGNQLLRHLTTILLNLEAGLLDEGTALIGEEYRNVGALVDAALEAIASGAPRSETNSIKDAMDRANDNANTDGVCEPTEDDEPDDDDSTDPEVPGACDAFVTGKKVTICHKGKNTLSVSINALAAHLGHGDTCGPCN